MATRTNTATLERTSDLESPSSRPVRALLQGIFQTPTVRLAEHDAIDRVKTWIAAGHVHDAAHGRDSAWLRDAAKAEALGSLPPLSLDQELELTHEELRVYVEARHWQDYFGTQPKTLEQAEADYTATRTQTIPQILAGLNETIASGRLAEELRPAWTARIASFEQELNCVLQGSLQFELASPELDIKPGGLRLFRDVSGLVIGACVVPSHVDWQKLCTRYSGHGARLAYAASEYFGGYVVTW